MLAIALAMVILVGSSEVVHAQKGRCIQQVWVDAALQE